MEKTALELKLGLTAFFTACTALWGWFGWLLLLWLGCLLLDFITGSMAAAAQGAWSSQQARRGIWHKLGSIVSVTVAAAADLLLGLVSDRMPNLPLEYDTLLCPMVLVWYVIAELGSILENAIRLGAPVPEVLQRALKLFREQADQE